MRNCWVVAAAFAASVFTVNTTLAADLAPRPYVKAPVMVNPAYDWSGFYLGGHVGYLWGHTRVIDDGILTEAGAPTNGVVGGVLLGYNWQSGPWVYGLEGDFGWSNARGTGTAGPPPPPLSTPNQYKLNWDSHIVGKLGYSWGQWMVFGTGGLAIADFSFTPGFVPPSVDTQQGGTYVGFSVGVGAEYAFTRNLIGRLQFIYDDFGGKTYIASDGGVYHASLTAETLRGALSWKF